MRWSQLYAPTLREDPADADAVSHRLLVRGGFVRQLMAGHYSLLPLAVRVRSKIIDIIREEMTRIGAQEFVLPALHPAEIWQRSGRWEVMGEEMFRLKDRKGAALALGMTLPVPQAQAFDWPDLWRRGDQQAAAAFAAPRPGERAALIEKLGPDSPWRALLLYRGGRYAEAALRFAAGDGADAHYNRGNALALDGRLEEALAAYGAALERSPSMRDALFNRALVREALARRRAQSQRGAQSGERRAASPAPSTVHPGSGTARGGAGPGAAGREARTGEEAAATRETTPTDQARSQAQAADAARRPEDAADGAERRRLEGLLAQVPDDPGSLLANRFAWQLQLRGNWHPDRGERW